MNSTWKYLKDCEGVYAISDRGEIRCDVALGGTPPGARKLNIVHAGYLQFHYTPIRLENGHFIRPHPTPPRRNVLVHRLVYETFIGPIPPRKQINHKNGVVNDNRVENLEIMTAKENVKHSIEVLGHSREGTKNHQAKLTEEQVISIRRRARAGEKFGALAREFRVSAVLIKKVATGESWQHLSEPVAPKGAWFNQHKLTSEEKEQINHALQQNALVPELSQRYNVTKTTIYNMRRALRSA